MLKVMWPQKKDICVFPIQLTGTFLKLTHSPFLWDWGRWGWPQHGEIIPKQCDLSFNFLVIFSFSTPKIECVIIFDRFVNLEMHSFNNTKSYYFLNWITRNSCTFVHNNSHHKNLCPRVFGVQVWGWMRSDASENPITPVFIHFSSPNWGQTKENRSGQQWRLPESQL